MKLYIVYKTGGDYDLEYVERIYNSLKEHHSAIELKCITNDMALQDEPYYIEMQEDYPGWWSKMELFRPDIDKDDFLYIDLDTIVVKDLVEIKNACKEYKDIPILLSDFFYFSRLASGVMWLPASFRKIVWEEWFYNPEEIMKKHSKYGDQEFISSVITDQKLDHERWQSILLTAVILSYKVHTRDRGITRNTELVCYHGKPRPKATNWSLK